MGRIVAFALALLVAGIHRPAKGEERQVKQPDRQVVRKKSQVDFNDMQVDGDLIRPDGTYVTEPGRIRFETLIRTRSSFVEELKRSGEGL
jgi:hypothetical protein